jgi:hypothetical protein
MTYAEKLKVKLAAVEQERDALRMELKELVALASRIAADSGPIPQLIGPRRCWSDPAG